MYGPGGPDDGTSGIDPGAAWSVVAVAVFRRIICAPNVSARRCYAGKEISKLENILLGIPFGFTAKRHALSALTV